MALVEVTVTEGLRLTPIDLSVRGRPVAAVDALMVGESLRSFFGVVLGERLRIGDTIAPQAFTNVLLVEGARLRDRLLPAYLVDLIEALEIASSAQLQDLVVVIERLRIAARLGGGGAYNLSLTQGLKLVDSLRQFFGAEVAEGLGITDELLATGRAIAAIVEELELTGTVAPQFLIHVTARDGIELDDIDLVQMLFSPTLVDGIEMRTAYIAPGRTTTAWAMNTRTAAVTEYRDFDFESFAQMGNRSIAASADGLFELRGDTDEDEVIGAWIAGGFLQFGGTQLSRLKEAYVSAPSVSGDMVLKIEDGEGHVYQYALSPYGLRSTRVHMGKGQRARYFAWELTALGQDFDLDTIEFVPLVVQRRV